MRRSRTSTECGRPRLAGGPMPKKTPQLIAYFFHFSDEMRSKRYVARNDGRLKAARRLKAASELQSTTLIVHTYLKAGKVTRYTVLEAKANHELVRGKPPAGPPKIIEQCVWLLLPRKLREAVIGDAEEAYWQTIRRYGSRAATLDY